MAIFLIKKNLVVGFSLRQKIDLKQNETKRDQC